MFISFFLTNIANAQKPLQKDSITILEEIILLDNLIEKRAEGITPSDIVGAKTFQNYSPLDAVSSLNQTPGIYVLSGALNTNRITIRGVGARTLFGTDKLRMYYNDIPITNGSGLSSIEAYDIENISQIEIIKGPKASTYGANLGGAILLESKELLENQTRFNNNFTIGSYNLIKNSFSFSHSDKKFSLALNYGHTKTDGYRDNNSFERDGLLLNSFLKITKRSELNFLLNYIDYTAQIPSSLGITDFTESPKKAAFTWGAAKGFEANKYTLLGLAHTYNFNKKLKNTTSIFYTYLDHYEARPFGILDEYTSGYGFRTRFRGVFNFINKKATYAFGGELYKDKYNWKEFDNLYNENNGNGSLQGDGFAKNKEDRTQLQMFGSITFALAANLEAQLGVNVNKTKYNFSDLFNTGTSNKSAQRKFKAIVLPNVNLKYTFLQNQQLYANVSRGFSNPTLEETLTPDGVINPDISQETGTNYEVGTQLYSNDKKLQFTMAMYQMNIKNLLVAERIEDDQYIGKNAGKTKHQGIEVASNYSLIISPKLKLNPFISYTYNHHKFVDFVDDNENFSGNAIAGVPKHRLTSGVQALLFNNFSLNVIQQYVGEIPLTDANALYSDSFSVVNTNLTFQKKISTQLAFRITLGVNNLFDTSYAQSVLINTQAFGSAEPRYYYPGNNKNYYGSLQLRYSL